MTAIIDQGFIRRGNMRAPFVGTVVEALAEGQRYVDALAAHANTEGVPAPTPSSVAQIVFESGMDVALPAPPPPLSLGETQAAKLIELQAAFLADLNAGFVSNALGAPHTYDSEAHNRENLIGAVAANVDTSYTCDDGLGNPDSKQSILHTSAQLLTVLRDGKEVKETLIVKLRAKRAAVKAAVTTANVEAVNWGI